MAEPITALQKRIIRKRVDPIDVRSLHAIGANVLRRDDAVLTKLAMSDEREYQRMFDTSVALSSAIEQRIMGLLQQGSEVVEGDSGSAEAGRNAAFARRILKGIPQWNTVQREMLMALVYGWRPIAIQWEDEPSLQFEGRTYLGIERLEAQNPWDYEFTTQRELVERRIYGPDQPRVFNREEMRYLWVVCSYGTTKSLYGSSWFKRLWMLYFLVKQFERMSAQAMQRSLGMLKVKWSGGSDMDGSGADQTQLEQAVSDMLDKLTANNVLMETADYTVEVLRNVEFSSSYREIMEYFGKELRIGVVGQNLTSEVKGGSLAAAKVHQETLESYWRSDARELSGWINDQLLRAAVEVNFGEQDSDDLPKWRSAVFSTPNAEGLKTYLDYGGRVDARRIAATYNVPIPESEADEELVLEKQASPSPFFGQPPTEGAAVASAPRIAAAASDQDAAYDAADAAVEKAFVSVLGRVSKPAATHYSGWAEKLLERNDPKAQRPSSG
jgi:Protein of unknown function (DUF935)